MSKKPGGWEKSLKRKAKEQRMKELLKKTTPLTALWRKAAAVECEAGPIQSNSKGEQDILPGGAVSPDSGDVVASEDSAIACSSTTELHVPSDEAPTISTASLATDNSQDLDIGLWPSTIDDNMRCHWAERGSSLCRNNDADFKATGKLLGTKVRYCNANFFRTKTHNGEVKDRNWLCFSIATQRLYCFPCKLVGCGDQLSAQGYDDWRNAGISLARHENSNDHRESVLKLVTLRMAGARVDMALTTQYESERNYWRAVLKRVVTVIKFLAERGLAFRGRDQTVGSKYNGNFLGVLELLALYDDFLGTHLRKHSNSGKGSVSYLSAQICEELIEVMGDKLLNKIISELKASKYYSISIDSTPDVSHVDQLVCILRYVLPDGPVERFMTYLSIESHTGQELANTILRFLCDHGIDIADCRGQSYDNAANMSGRYRGVQAVIAEKNSLAVFVPCCGHSLNLVGQCAVSCCDEAVRFFDFVQQIYNFFASSTYKWKKLTDALNKQDEHLVVVKRLSNTRWSAHADATKALKCAYPVIAQLLGDIAEDENEKADIRLQAKGLYLRSIRLETAFMSEFWYDMLQAFHKCSSKLQDASLDLNTATGLLSSLQVLVDSFADQFDALVERATQVCGEKHFSASGERRSRTAAADDHHSDTERFRATVFDIMVNKLSSALSSRQQAYAEICNLFGFLSSVHNLTTSQIRLSCSRMVARYSDDLDDSLADEMVSFAAFMKPILECPASNPGISNEQVMFATLQKQELTSVFPNVEVALRLYLSIMISNCSGERSFSKLKLLKNELRSTTSQQRLNHLSLMSIEFDLLRKIDFDDVIDEFARRKARKRPLL